MKTSIELLKEIVQYKAEYDLIPLDGPDDELHVYNDWFSTVDMELLYGMVRHLKPARMIEVGSGHSTRCTLMAIAANATDCAFTAIDPEPRLAVDDLTGLTIMRKRAENVPIKVYETLEAGDILFIDSSHIWAAGNDVDVLYHTILPDLPSGVIVHVHDVFLPDGYPGHWWDRGYTEHQYVAPFLVSGEWDVLLSAHYLRRKHPHLLAEGFRSYHPEADPASLWMVKR